VSIFEHIQRKSQSTALPVHTDVSSLHPQTIPTRNSKHPQTMPIRNPGHALDQIPILPPERTNRTGLPVSLKSGIEHLSGVSIDDVRVHYHSAKPAQLQALAYTQGTDIYVGSGQEQHLAHEAWHVIQQKQNRVRAVLQARGTAINDDVILEREADVMGKKAKRISSVAGMHTGFYAQSGGTRATKQGSGEASSRDQPVAQLMKLSALNTAASFQSQYGPGKGNYKILDLRDGYHITIFPNQDTYDKFPDLSKQPHENSTLALPDISSFEFDEFHVTHVVDGRHDHFFYAANGKPLTGPMSAYAKSGHSVDFNDERWYATNQIVADLLGVHVDSINAHWNVPESVPEKNPDIMVNKGKNIKKSEKSASEIIYSLEVKKQMAAAEKLKAAAEAKQEQEQETPMQTAPPVKFNIGLAKPPAKNAKKPIAFNIGGTQPAKEAPEASGTIEDDEERAKKRSRKEDDE
jgi:hypothetical protein